METKHTPGPWTLYRYAATQDTHHHAVFASARDDGRRVTIATVYPVGDDGQTGGESYHNARLIAAAPAMLKALETIIKFAKEADKLYGDEYDESIWPEGVLEQGRAAIQAALGE